MRSSSFSIALIFVVLAGLVAGCKQGSVREVLDEETLVSVISMTPAFTFFRFHENDNVEREFVSLGPVDRIRSAERGQFLWVNTWATERSGALLTVPLPDRITLATQIDEIELRRAANSHDDLNISKAPYRVMNRGEGEAYYHLTSEHLDTLRDAPLVSISFNGHRYALWGNQSAAHAALATFIVETTGY